MDEVTQDDFDYDDGECGNCGGEGFTYGCSWDWQCNTYDLGEGTCLCTRRCEWCNPLTATEQAVGAAMQQALAATITRLTAELEAANLAFGINYKALTKQGQQLAATTAERDELRAVIGDSDLVPQGEHAAAILKLAEQAVRIAELPEIGEKVIYGAHGIELRATVTGYTEGWVNIELSDGSTAISRPSHLARAALKETPDAQG